MVLVANLRARLDGNAALPNPTALARKADVDPGYMSKLMRLKAAPTIDLLEKFAHALGCQPWELLVDEDATREDFIRRMLGR